MTAARLVQRFPKILDSLARGEVHLSALVLLRDHLTEDNHEALLRAAVGKTKLEIEEMIATWSPRPDVPSRITEVTQKTPQQALLDPAGAASTRPIPAAEPRARIEPLSPARYRIELTASAELREKLVRAQDLMRHRHPSGDRARGPHETFEICSRV